jgi:hypothetical protein
MATTNKDLFNEFQAVTKQHWKAQVEKESVKDFAYENLIVEKGGLKIEPYYTNEGAVATTLNTSNSDWQIRQNFVAEDFKNTNLKIVKALENGVSALGIIIKHTH